MTSFPSACVFSCRISVSPTLAADLGWRYANASFRGHDIAKQLSYQNSNVSSILSARHYRRAKPATTSTQVRRRGSRVLCAQVACRPSTFAESPVMIFDPIVSRHCRTTGWCLFPTFGLSNLDRQTCVSSSNRARDSSWPI